MLPQRQRSWGIWLVIKWDPVLSSNTFYWSQKEIQVGSQCNLNKKQRKDKGNGANEFRSLLMNVPAR